jgi:hypothetical protein
VSVVIAHAIEPAVTAEERLPAPRMHPPRAAAVMTASRRLEIVDCLHGFGRLLDLQHEYPAEAFYAIDDGPMDARQGREANRVAALSLASACLAFGLQSNKVVVFVQSALPQSFELLWSLRHVSPRPVPTPLPRGRHDERAESGCPDLIVDRATMFAATCLVLRATTIAARPSQLAGYRLACRLAEGWRTLCTTCPLPRATLRLLDSTYAEPGYAGGACRLSPFLSPRQLETELYTMWNAGDGAGLTRLRRCWARLYAALVSDERRSGAFAEQLSSPVGGGAAARTLAQAIAAWSGPAVERYHALVSRPDYVSDVLREGRLVATEQAALTMAAIRRACGEGED